MQCIACNGTGKWKQGYLTPPKCPICGWGDRSILGAATLAMSRHIVNHHTMHEIHTAMSHGRISLIGGKYIVAPDNDKCGICEGTGQVCDTCGESIPDDGDYLCFDCGGGE